MKRALFALCAIAACGGTKAPDAHVRWAGDATHPPPPSFGAVSVDATRAIWNAATHLTIDPRWQCDDGATDLRATPADTKAQLAPLGPAPQLVYAAAVVSFDSPAKGYAPEDVVDVKGAADAKVFFHARALVNPDGHAAWMEANPAPPDSDQARPWAYLASLEQPNDDRAPIDQLPDGVRQDLAKLVASASSGACDVPVATIDDLNKLPYDLGKDARDLFAARADALKRQLPRFCATVSKGTGPWEVHWSHIEAGYANGNAVATLRAKIHLQSGVPCLGPVDVVKVGNEQ